MGIKGHQSSISLATVQTWVLKDTKAVYHKLRYRHGYKRTPKTYITSYGTDMGIKGHQNSISLATVQTWVLKDTKAVYH